MQDAKLFERMLGLQAPWRVKSVELDMKGQKGVLVAEVTAVTQWGEGGQQLPVYGWEERECRHLDTMQFETVIRAPLTKCLSPYHGEIVY